MDASYFTTVFVFGRWESVLHVTVVANSLYYNDMYARKMPANIEHA